jgi:hypothetical protein
LVKERLGAASDRFSGPHSKQQEKSVSNGIAYNGGVKMKNRFVPNKTLIQLLCLFIVVLLCSLAVGPAQAYENPKAEGRGINSPPQTGSIRITLEPESIISAGAQWRYRLSTESSWSAWLNNGSTAGGLAAGEYVLDFKPIAGWIAPQNFHIILGEGEAKSSTIMYTELGGNIIVTINPAEAVSAGAQWRLPDSSYLYWVNSGSGLTNLQPGTYTLEFKEIAGWDRPANFNISIVYGQTVSFSGTYTRQTGSLRVVILPAEAVAEGAQWRRIRTETWHDSGYTETGVPVDNNCVIEFKTLPGWNYPVLVARRIEKDQTAVLTQSYSRPTGTFRVNIEPSAAINAGAQWRHRRLGENNWSEWHNHDYVITNLISCAMQVEYKELPGWIRPFFAQVEHHTDAATAITGTYTMNMGSLLVNIAPAAARTAGAFWRLAGKTGWLNSGLTVQYIPAGDWTIEFFEPAAWKAPTNVIVRINKDQTTTYYAVFTEERGSIQVTIQPQGVVAAGAQWRRVGTLTWFDSGYLETDVPAGECTLEFKDVQYWRGPGEQRITVSNAQTTSYTATYTSTLPGGSFNVTIAPQEALSAGAKWRYVSQDQTVTSSWYDSGQAVSSVPPGQYTVQFLDITNWAAPDARSLTVSPSLTTYVNATYEILRGSLKVYMLPKDVPGLGARWRRVGTSTWRTNGYTETNIPAQAYDIEFKDVAGWIRPENQQTQVAAGQTNQLTATYTQAVGSLTVTLTPLGAVNSGAAWRRTVNVKPWYQSGQTEQKVAAGDYIVIFKDVEGYTKPADVSVGITVGQNTAITAAYTYITGAMRIAVQPQEAAAAGAGWRRKGTDKWNESGYTEAGLPPGFHQVEFKDIGGWTKPTDRNVEIRANQTTDETAIYTNPNQPGSLTVTIEPQEAADEGAKWRVLRAGESAYSQWYESGRTLDGFAPGDLTIEFLNVFGWRKPDNTGFTVLPGEDKTFTATYISVKGTLTVNIGPSGAVQAGAKWRPAGTTSWRDSGYSELLPTGNYTVEFSDLQGWNKPAGRQVSIAAGQTTTVNESYSQAVQAGSLTVTIEPQEAVAAGAKWRMAKTVQWYDGGYTLGDIVNDSFTVEFMTIPGWDTPASRNVTINQGQIITITGTYVRQTGSLSVSVTPSEATKAGAKWRIAGSEEWHGSGDEIGYLPPVAHTVEFNTLSGWDKPENISITVIPGRIARGTGAYTRQTGALTLTLSPQAAVDAQARWRRSGTSVWRSSGFVEKNLAVNDYTIEFKEIKGWKTPSDLAVLVEANSTTSVDQAYSPLPATLTVTITPDAALAAGALWRLTGTASWQESGYTEADAPLGNQTVEFADVTGWDKPADKSIAVKPGQALKISAAYIPRKASLVVTIEPQEAFSAGARWRLKGTSQWRTSGYLLSNLDAGSRTVEFKAVQGWDKPTDLQIELQPGGTASGNGVYVLQNGTLVVTIKPQVVVGAGAKWRRVGMGVWRDSGTQEQHIEPGTYQVEFTDVQDWAKPADQEVTVRPGQETAITVVYASQTGALKVDLRPRGAVNDGAKWKLAGTDTWYDDGHTLSDLPMGNYTIKFKNVQGWIKPEDVEVIVSPGKTATAVGRYTRPKETQRSK